MIPTYSATVLLYMIVYVLDPQKHLITQEWNYTSA